MVLTICLKSLDRGKRAKATETGVDNAEQQNHPACSPSARYARAHREKKKKDPKEWKELLEQAARGRDR